MFWHLITDLTDLQKARYLYTISKYEIISSVRKRYCALGLVLELGLGLG